MELWQPQLALDGTDVSLQLSLLFLNLALPLFNAMQFGTVQQMTFKQVGIFGSQYHQGIPNTR